MNLPTHTRKISASEAEEMLRAVARLPAPQGLEDRMHAALRKAPRTATVLSWPAPGASSRGWMRGAAAAAIVFVVAGGGWGIAARLHPAEPARVIAMPRVTTGGGFSSAGAMRTPQTFNVPAPAVAQHAVVPNKKLKKSAAAKPGAKTKPSKLNP